MALVEDSLGALETHSELAGRWPQGALVPGRRADLSCPVCWELGDPESSPRPRECTAAQQQEAARSSPLVSVRLRGTESGVQPLHGSSILPLRVSHCLQDPEQFVGYSFHWKRFGRYLHQRSWVF